jgi:serine/threonine-protein kinase
MAAIAADRDLLFGLLALQNGLIDQGQLVAAFQAWSLDRARSLAEYLVTRGDLNPAQRAAIEVLATLHVDKHGGDADKSLAAIPNGRSTLESLARIGDPVIGATLVRAGSTLADRDGDADRTASYAVSILTSDGQRFRILRPHAKGGLGAVFVALDTELQREVALKQILDAHADDAGSRRRFLLEAQVTGGLEHPGIVPVYGLGTYADGRPYYAMRFVRGECLKEAIERFHTDEALKGDPGRRSLELRKLLRRFLDVCNAIDYAHSRGVLHRDIKPANVIVGRHGETLVVDWGLAKATGRSDPCSAERTLVPGSASGTAETLPGSALGTPAYMSPEQAEGRLDLLEPRSDVYSLGATLYCLLTGRPPFEGDVADVIRAVQRGDFRPPHSVDPTIDRALEAVCLKAMALRPEDRYGSCRALAEDVDRWMADEPVSAWREPWTVRARRRLARHRTLVAAGMAAVVVAIAGLAAVLLVQAKDNQQLVISNDRLRESVSREQGALRQVQSAMERERETNRSLTIANAHEQEARRQVQEQFALALEAVENSTREASDTALLDPALRKIHRHGLEKALGFYKRLRASLEGRTAEAPTARADLAMTYHRMATLSGRLGSPEDAWEAFRKAIALREELLRDEATVVRHRRDLADSYAEYAWLLFGAGKSAEGVQAYRRAIELLEPLARGTPGGDAKAGLALVLHRFGGQQSAVGRVDEALEAFGREFVIRKELARDHPEVPEYRHTLAVALRLVGDCHSLSGRPVEALEAYRKSQDLLERQLEADPADPMGRSELAVVINNIGLNHMKGGRLDEALRSYRRNLAIHQELVQSDPTNTWFRQMLAFAHGNVGEAELRAHRTAEALQSCRESLALHEALAVAYPGEPRFQNDLIEIHGLLAKVHVAMGRAAQALADVREAERIVGHGAVPQPMHLQSLAGGYAMLSTLVGPEERRTYADRAMAMLRRALSTGRHDVAELQSDPDLGALRSRSDFQLLMMDLAFPAEPFAAPR